ncbi:MAG: nitric oxide reductase F protein [Cypionkella sp.]
METRAWIALLALSAITTTLAVVQPALTGWAIAASSSLLLVLAWLKARVILARYLGLAAAPDWLRGFNLVLALYAILLLALTLAA